MEFKETINLAENVIERFEKIEGKPWKAEGSVIELQKQVGELAKYVMNTEGYYFSDRYKDDNEYSYNSDKENIADELADIFYAIIRIARYYKIDLEQAHIKARKAEDDFLKNKEIDL